MFDRFIDRPKTRRPWLAAFLGCSVLAHVGMASVLLITAMWQIDKLAAPNREIYSPVQLQLGEPPPEVEPTTRPITPKRPKRPKELVQPTKETLLEDVEISIEPPGGAAEGHPDGIPGGTGDCVGCISGGTSDFVPILEIEEPPRALANPLKIIPPHVLEGQRVSGDEQIHPPDTVRLKMARDGRSRLHGVIEMCLDKSGRVSSLKIRKSTGYQNYDRKILDGMELWHYRPYRADGKPIPVCTSVTWIYVMR
ncbi:MAG: hypothetical protein MJE77_04820 [Proteobacteria bacterium]|nr:hypothetical protein [Pseudomonadota bacterium]